MTTKPEMKPKKKGKKYYRSPLDKVVVESKMTAKKIAEKMGITYDRMVALRRVKTLAPEILDLCKRAVSELNDGNMTPLQPVDQERKEKVDKVYFKKPKTQEEFNHAADALKYQSTSFRSVAPGEKVVIPNPFDTEMWKQPQNIVPMQPSMQEKLEKASFLLGLAFSQLMLQRDFIHQQGICESEATEKMFMRLTTGIEELFYKDK